LEVNRVKRLALLFLVLGLAACGSDSPTAVPDSGVVEKTDLVVGTGAEAVNGDTLTVHYTGWLADGTKFDSSYDRGTPFTFRVGVGQVIAGWDQGVPGMKVGGKRRLIIPPSLGYGSTAYGPIPANSTLKFEVELLSIAGK
jgi:FKBP-type peptidyl-prolyl cis-trans isomerase